VRRAPIVIAAILVGCAGGSSGPPPIPIAIGPGPAYRPPSLSPAVTAARPVGRLRCSRAQTRRFGVYVELLAHRRVVLIPAGIGIAPPRLEQGAYVSGGRCSYPLRTREPTGVIEVAAGTGARLGDLFDLWGQPLSKTRLASFATPPADPVRVYVNGRRAAGDPRSIRLRGHAAIVVELGAYLAPHREYRFPPGL
jgi:hypothetical protein